MLAGNPVALIWKLPFCSRVKVVVLALVKVGAWFTTRRKFCVASGISPLVAVIVKSWLPLEPEGGVPVSSPVLLSMLTQPGWPLRLNVGAGVPLALTVNVPGVRSVNVVVLALVNSGAP